MSEKKLYLLDAFALIYRAYYSMIRSPRITSYGKNTNAQYGFTNSLLDILKNNQPSHIAVCFDSLEGTTRSEDYSDYKANREAAPEDIIEAIPDIKDIIHGFNIPIVEIPGYEADDIIGGLAKQAENEGYEVYMVTPDKDFGQLVSDQIFMLKPAARGEGPMVMGPEEVCEKWDIERVDQVIDLLGLMGDASDNIPGIKGVGEKTAVKLLKEYGTLENVLDHADEIKGKLGEKIRDGKQDAILSKMLATIITDIPYEFDEISFLREEPNQEELRSIFEKLEFRTMGKRVLGDDFSIKNKTTQAASLFDNPNSSNETDSIEGTPESPNSIGLKTLMDVKVDYQLIDSVEAIEKWSEKIPSGVPIAIDTETDGLDITMSTPVGVSISWKENEAYYINLNADDRDDRISSLRNVLHPLENMWIGHNIKFDRHMLQNIGIILGDKSYDTMLAHYVIDPASKHSLDELAERYLYYKPISITKILGPKGKGQKNMRDISPEKIKNYACEDADITFQLYQYFENQTKEDKDTKEIIEDLECPLSTTLLDMETEGVYLDQKFLHDYSDVLQVEINETEKKIYQYAGTEFNISSPKQIGEILFDNMHLIDKPKKTKTGQYKTGEEELRKLEPLHPIVGEILNYRELTKLKSTYVDALPKMVSPKDGKIHTTFSQSVAVTGRLSSNNPNLQNIPIKTERGREIRKAFIPSPGNLMLSADYSQIELRIMAYFSQDKTMIQAFQNDEDIHKTTASKVFDVPTDEVTTEMRYKAKAVNFGIIYGQTPFGLSQSLGISTREAKEIIDNYFEEFPSIKKFMDDTIYFAKSHIFVKTILGRKRYLPDINSANSVVRGFAERTAINSPIQGTAADLIKMAMLRIHHKLLDGYQSKLILQVHDELVIDLEKTEKEKVQDLVESEMTNVYPLGDVPLKISIGTGENWLEAH